MEYTLRVQGTTEDDLQLLQRLVEVLQENSGEEEDAYEDQWDEEGFVDFWQGLRGNAKKALREISEQPDGYPVDDLLAELGVSGSTLGGHLSSVGFRMRHFGNYEWPYYRDWENHVYTMPSEVAGIIQSNGL
jgi:hypothetical protein